jgi:drug/metabolite transporter, DME family
MAACPLARRTALGARERMRGGMAHDGRAADDKRPAAARPAPTYARGVVCVLAGGTCLSLGGVLIRHIETAGGWQIVFYRAIGFVLALSIFLAFRHRRRFVASFLAVGWPGVIAAVSLGLGTACYVFGMLLTSVANVVFTLSVGPFFAAAAAWLVLGERVRTPTLLAMLVAAGGVGLMFADGLVSGTWLGNLVALGAPLTLAVTVVAWRARSGVDMVPATCLSGVVGLLIGAVMADGLAVSPHDLLLSLVLGSVQLGAGFLFLTLGARSVPAGEVPLYGLAETVLGPIWVWLAINEVPSAWTLSGGAIVLTAVVLAALAGLRAAGPGGGPPSSRLRL